MSHIQEYEELDVRNFVKYMDVFPYQQADLPGAQIFQNPDKVRELLQTINEKRSFIRTNRYDDQKAWAMSKQSEIIDNINSMQKLSLPCIDPIKNPLDSFIPDDPPAISSSINGMSLIQEKGDTFNGNNNEEAAVQRKLIIKAKITAQENSQGKELRLSDVYAKNFNLYYQFQEKLALNKKVQIDEHATVRSSMNGGYNPSNDYLLNDVLSPQSNAYIKQNYEQQIQSMNPYKPIKSSSVDSQKITSNGQNENAHYSTNGEKTTQAVEILEPQGVPAGVTNGTPVIGGNVNLMKIKSNNIQEYNFKLQKIKLQLNQNVKKYATPKSQEFNQQQPNQQQQLVIFQPNPSHQQLSSQSSIYDEKPQYHDQPLAIINLRHDSQLLPIHTVKTSSKPKPSNQLIIQNQDRETLIINNNLYNCNNNYDRFPSVRLGKTQYQAENLLNSKNQEVTLNCQMLLPNQGYRIPQINESKFLEGRHKSISNYGGASPNANSQLSLHSTLLEGEVPRSYRSQLEEIDQRLDVYEKNYQQKELNKFSRKFLVEDPNNNLYRDDRFRNSQQIPKINNEEIDPQPWDYHNTSNFSHSCSMFHPNQDENERLSSKMRNTRRLFK